MRYGVLLKVLPYMVLLLISANLWCAEYKDGELWLEVLLDSGAEISLNAGSGDKPVCIVREQGSPVTLELSGSIRFQIYKQGSESAESTPQKSYAWVNSTLEIDGNHSPMEFPSILDEYEDLIEQLYLKTHSPEQGSTDIGSIVKLTVGRGYIYYLQPPLIIEAQQPVIVSGMDLPFRGTFILKGQGAKLTLNHFLPLETYIAGVIQNEIGSNAPIEALKAQAVAARTHALKMLFFHRHSKEGYDLCSGTHCQVYKGEFRQNQNVLEAVAATTDEILIWEDELAETTYHSSCGGKTESSAAIWKGIQVPYSQGVVCFPQSASWDLSREDVVRRWIETPLELPGASSWEKATLNWSACIDRHKLAENLGMKFVNRIVINKRGYSGRIIDMSFTGSDTVRLTSEYKIRSVFGSLSSSLFYIGGVYSAGNAGSAIIYPSSVINVTGRGSGHGVGMCQVGALTMARQGTEYMDILHKFYPGTEPYLDWMSYDYR